MTSDTVASGAAGGRMRRDPAYRVHQPAAAFDFGLNSEGMTSRQLGTSQHIGVRPRVLSTCIASARGVSFDCTASASTYGPELLSAGQ